MKEYWAFYNLKKWNSNRMQEYWAFYNLKKWNSNMEQNTGHSTI